MIKTDKYPVFKPNQVLSDGQMNKIMGYLEPQDRATRTMAIGRGIVCGLELQTGSEAIEVSPGIGLTSAGHLLAVDQPLQYRFAAAFVPTNPYQPFLRPDGGGAIELLELAVSRDPDDPTSIALAELNLAEYVAAIFVNDYEFDLTTCLPENCDNQGAERRLEWRVLLLRRDDALEILKKADSRLAAAVDEAEATRILQARYLLPPLTLRRPLLGPAQGVRFTTLTRSYSDICREELARFKEAVTATYSCYQALVGPVNINEVVEELYAHFRRLHDGRGLQYFWDFLDDLFHAYNEFLDRAFELCALSGVTAGTFSHHLLLGPAENLSSCRPTIFRHHFCPALQDLFYGDQPGEVALLFQRLVRLIKGFSWQPGAATLRITPQQLGKSFDGRAIAHYLDRDQVAPVWNLAARRYCSQDLIPSYHRQDDRLLQDNLVDCNHLRIEGHMYRGKEEVLTELEKLRTTYNLPFAIKCLELGPVPDSASGGCSLASLRILYQVARLDVLCFVEDKIRFLNSIVADDLEFDTADEEQQEREKERQPTRIEAVKQLDFAEVIDFSRNRVFVTQKRKAQQRGAINMLARAGEFGIGSQPATAEIRSVVYEPTTTAEPYGGRKQSRYAKDFDEAELEKIEVPTGVKELVGRTAAIPRQAGAESFARVLTPKAEAGKKEVPVEEDSTSFTIKARDIAFAFPKTPVTDYLKYPKDELGDRLLSELVGNLVKMLEELPEEVHFYDPGTVQKLYAVIKDKALALKDIVEELLGSQDYAPRGVEYALIAELLELVDGCLDQRLGRIVELHNSEWQAAEYAGIFADYLRRHPGLHHCGGVHVGGTHVLVSGYIDKVREITKIRELTQPLFVKAPLAVYKELRGNVYENVLRTAGHFNRKAFTWSKRLDKERIADKTLAKEDLAPAITLDRTRSALLDGLLRTIESRSDEEQILFDFCHPYICCSDCSSIEYVVIAELKLYLPKLAFCLDDAEMYAFGVYPPGGVVSGAGVRKIGDTFYFTPAASGLGEQLFSYRFGGREVQLVARVMARPQARFTYAVAEFVSGSEGIATAAIVRFTNLSVDAEDYHWDFGDGLISVENSPTHTYDLTGQNTFKVTLTARAEACSGQATEELSLVPISFYVEKHLAEFCNADTGAYRLITEPPGGEFGEDEALDPATASFHPDRVKLAGKIRDSRTLTYQVGQQQVALTLEVFAPPQTGFTAEILPSGEQSVLVRFLNRTVNATAYRWDFGDGQGASLPEPTHEYRISERSEFEVTLTAVNGPCQKTVAQPLTLTPLLLRFAGESKGLFCETDETGVELLGTPEGGTFSGPGVEGTRFVPARVDMGLLSKKTLTLQYTLGTRSTSLLAVVYRYPVLAFTQVVSPAMLGVTVAFTNRSAHAEQYVWDFGDGSEATGYSISHFYKVPGAYRVTLRGINPACSATLAKMVAAVVEKPQEAETVPARPLKALTGALETPALLSLLKEFGVNGAYLADFYRQLVKIVAIGEKELAAFVSDESQFVGPATELLKLGDQMYRYGNGLQPTQLSLLIGLYRLGLANILNVMIKRTTDLTGRSELLPLLEKLSAQAARLSAHLGFEKFQTMGFELVPQSYFDDLPGLQQLLLALVKVL